MEEPPIVAVTFVSSHSRAGGSERYLETLLRGLEPGWVRDVICLEAGPLVDRLAASGKPPLVLPTAAGGVSVGVAAWRLRRRLARRRPDVVHANGIKAALVAALAVAGTRTPLVWVKHDFAWDGPLARALAHRATCVVGVSSAVLEAVEDTARGRTRVIHNAVQHVPPDRPGARETLLALVGPPEPSGVVLVVGRIHPIKGQLEMVESAPLVLARLPGTRFAFVGGPDPSAGDYEQRLRERIGGLGLSDAICLLGRREDAARLVGGADVVVIPSIPHGRNRAGEGFPLVGLEAMAAGTPVVGYREGGIPELLGECGRLVPTGDRESLAAALVEVLTEPAVHGAMARCGLGRVRESFAPERALEETKEVYRQAARIAHRHGRAGPSNRWCRAESQRTP